MVFRLEHPFVNTLREPEGERLKLANFVLVAAFGLLGKGPLAGPGSTVWGERASISNSPTKEERIPSRRRLFSNEDSNRMPLQVSRLRLLLFLFFSLLHFLFLFLFLFIFLRAVFFLLLFLDLQRGWNHLVQLISEP